MRYSYQNAKVLLIADMAIHDDSRYIYQWDINYTKKDIETVYGYKIYYSFKELGVKDIKLTVTDKALETKSVYTDKMYIVQGNFLEAGKFLPGITLSLFLGRFGEGYVDLMVSGALNVGETISDLAIYTFSNLPEMAGKTFRCYLRSGQDDTTITGYTEISFDETGILIPLTNSGDPDGWNISLGINDDYHFIYCDLYVDTYEIINGQEISRWTGQYIGQLPVHLGIGAVLHYDDLFVYGMYDICSWYGRLPANFYIAAATNNLLFTETFPYGIITKDDPLVETTNIFDILSVEKILNSYVFNGNYVYYHPIISTAIENTLVPIGLSTVNYTLICYKDNFPSVSAPFIVNQLSRNLITAPYSNLLTFTSIDDIKVFQITKEIGKKVRIHVTDVPFHNGQWWHFSLALFPVSEVGLKQIPLRDDYYAIQILYDFTDEPNNTNEIAIILEPSLYIEFPFTCNLSITQV